MIESVVVPASVGLVKTSDAEARSSTACVSQTIEVQCPRKKDHSPYFALLSDTQKLPCASGRFQVRDDFGVWAHFRQHSCFEVFGSSASMGIVLINEREALAGHVKLGNSFWPIFLAMLQYSERAFGNLAKLEAHLLGSFERVVPRGDDRGKFVESVSKCLGRFEIPFQAQWCMSEGVDSKKEISLKFNL